jgi:hypothetical protein
MTVLTLQLAKRKLEMTRPETPYEAASYDLNKFRERRLADRRFSPRTSADRRVVRSETNTNDETLAIESEIEKNTD